MTVFGVSMMKDEADIAATVLRHLVAEGVDHLIVADNLSSDGTTAILADLSEQLPLTVVVDSEIGYYQTRKMSRLARMAYEQGATWVLPFDADEVWYSPHGTIAQALAEVPEDRQIVRAGGWDHVVRDWESAKETWSAHVGCGSFSPFRRPQMQQLVKVAFRAHPNPSIHMGNHDVNLPDTAETDIRGVLEFRHFQYRSLEQMTRKLRNGRAAYEATDLHPAHGTHWRAGGLRSDAELAADWAELCATPDLVFDPAPIRVEVGA